MRSGEIYAYNITTDDPNLPDGDTLTIKGTILPPWLTLVDHGDGTATQTGAPTQLNVGDHMVMLQVTDFDGETASQSFMIRVEPFKFVFPLFCR